MAGHLEILTEWMEILSSDKFWYCLNLWTYCALGITHHPCPLSVNIDWILLEAIYCFSAWYKSEQGIIFFLLILHMWQNIWKLLTIELNEQHKVHLKLYAFTLYIMWILLVTNFAVTFQLSGGALAFASTLWPTHHAGMDWHRLSEFGMKHRYLFFWDNKITFSLHSSFSR